MSDPLKSYLLTIDTTKIDRTKATEIIDGMPNIVNWRTLFMETIMIVSPSSLSEIHHQMRGAFPERNFILIALEGTKKNGWLPRRSWDFMNHPKGVGDA